MLRATQAGSAETQHQQAAGESQVCWGCAANGFSQPRLRNAEPQLWIGLGAGKTLSHPHASLRKAAGLEHRKTCGAGRGLHHGTLSWSWAGNVEGSLRCTCLCMSKRLRWRALRLRFHCVARVCAVRCCKLVASAVIEVLSNKTILLIVGMQHLAHIGPSGHLTINADSKQTLPIGSWE